MIVYRTENLINKKFYYGVHNTAEDDGYLGSGTALTNAISKYGKENFKRRTVAEFETKEEAYELERLIVDERLTRRNDCYNISIGGYGGNTGNYESVAEKLTGRKYSEDHKKKISDSKKGKALSESHKKKISESTKGDKNHFYGRVDNSRNKIVLDTETGIYYESMNQAARAIGSWRTCLLYTSPSPRDS